jgi:hypothetical protein
MLEEISLGDGAKRAVALELAVRPEAAGVHHPLGDVLTVEVEDLSTEFRGSRNLRLPWDRAPRS